MVLINIQPAPFQGHAQGIVAELLPGQPEVTVIELPVPGAGRDGITGEMGPGKGLKQRVRHPLVPVRALVRAVSYIAWAAHVDLESFSGGPPQEPCREIPWGRRG